MSLKREETQGEGEKAGVGGKGTLGALWSSHVACRAGEDQDLQTRGPPASQSMRGAGQSLDIPDPSPVLGKRLKPMRRGGPSRQLSQHLLSPRDPLILPERVSGPQRTATPPDTGHVQEGTSSSPGVVPGQYSVQGPKASSLKPTVPRPRNPTCALGLGPSLTPCLTPSNPEGQKRRSGRNDVEDWGVEAVKQSLLILPRKGH